MTALKDKAASRQGIRVIARAAEVLRALEGREDGLSLGQLARQLALPRSTVQRIVNALDAENFVIAASPNARVRLGPALMRLAGSTRFRIVELARPYIEELSGNTGETVDLSVRDNDKLVFLDQVPGSHRLRAVSAIGVSFPLHCSANGKALLASLDDEELERLRPNLALEPLTGNTITSWKRLAAEIAAIRKEGVAYDREEHSPGISAVASAVRGHSGEVAAISIPTPTQRFSALEPQLIAGLKETCARLRQALGPD